MSQCAARWYRVLQNRTTGWVFLLKLKCALAHNGPVTMYAAMATPEMAQLLTMAAQAALISSCSKPCNSSQLLMTQRLEPLSAG